MTALSSPNYQVTSSSSASAYPRVWNFDDSKKTEFQRAIKALKKAEPYQNWSGITKSIGIIGLIIAGTLGATALIQFSASFLPYFAGSAVTAIAFMILSKGLNKKVEQLTVNKGITEGRRAELAALYFRDSLITKTDFCVDAIFQIERETDKVYFQFIFNRHNLISHEIPIFAIDDKFLPNELIVDLLVKASEKKVILHLRSLEECILDSRIDEIIIEWKDRGLNKKEASLMQRSIHLSTLFIKKAIAEGKLNADQINLQLNALSPKFYSNIQRLHPVKASFEVSSDLKKIRVTSRLGEVGNLENILQKLDQDGLKIEIFGAGFKAFQLGPQTEKCFRPIILDKRNEKIDEWIWQDETVSLFSPSYMNDLLCIKPNS